MRQTTSLPGVVQHPSFMWSSLWSSRPFKVSSVFLVRAASSHVCNSPHWWLLIRFPRQSLLLMQITCHESSYCEPKCPVCSWVCVLQPSWFPCLGNGGVATLAFAVFTARTNVKNPLTSLTVVCRAEQWFFTIVNLLNFTRYVIWVINYWHTANPFITLSMKPSGCMNMPIFFNTSRWKLSCSVKSTITSPITLNEEVLSNSLTIIVADLCAFVSISSTIPVQSDLFLCIVKFFNLLSSGPWNTL